MNDGGDSGVVLLDNQSQIEPTWDEFIITSEIVSVPSTAPGPPATTTCTSQKFFGSTFSTAKVQEAFGIAQPSGAKDYLVLGLDTTQDKQHNINEVFTAFNVSSTTFPEPLDGIISAFKTNQAAVNALPTFIIENRPRLKNGLWLVPVDTSSLQITTALTFQLNLQGTFQFLQSIGDSFASAFGLQVDLSDLTFQPGPNTQLPRLRLKSKTFITKNGENDFSTDSVFELIVEMPVKGFLVTLRIGTNGELELSVLDDSTETGNIFTKLAGLLENAPTESQGSPSESNLLVDPSLWKVSVLVEPSQTGKKFSWKIAFVVTLHIVGKTFTIGLIYDNKSGTFAGGLLFKSMFDDRLSPSFDDLSDLPNEVIDTLTDGLDLVDSDHFKTLPNVVPTKLTEAFFVYRKATGSRGSKFSFSATLERTALNNPIGNQSVPFPFQWNSISLDLTRENETLLIDVFSSFQLNPKSPRFQKALLSVDFIYDQASNLWSLAGHAENIQLGAIAEFFDPDLSDQVLDILGKLNISNIDVSYTYQKNVASSFLFVGMIEFGDLRLKVYYQYTTKEAAKSGQTAADKVKSGGSDPNLTPIQVPPGNDTFWQLDAYLDTSGPDATIGTIADSIIDNASDELPHFVRDIHVHNANADNHLISLHASKETAQGGGGRALFVLNVAFSELQFAFLQVSTKVSQSDGTSTANTKKLLRLSVGHLPFIDSLPVVKELPQPYQELQYMYSPAGMSRDEVAAINAQLGKLGMENKLYFKPATQADVDSSKPDSIVLVGGHHFVVVNNNDAVLDHVFNPGKKKDSTQPAGNPPQPPPRGGSESQGGSQPQGGNNNGAIVPASNLPAAGVGAGDDQVEKPPTKGTMNKQTQFLSISAISLQYKDGKLWVFLDATLALGPLEFSLLGFGIGININKPEFTLDNLVSIIKDLDFQLRGMSVEFNQPPVLISGVFEHDEVMIGTELHKSYRGGVAVSVEPYSFLAVGEYTEVVIEPGRSYKSVFVYAKLDGPLIDLEFAILRGVRLGFGYNSMIRSPSVQEIYLFPFINDAGIGGAGNHPMKVLENIRGGVNPWVSTRQDSYWFAFGFTISSFNIINATAVAIVSFRNGGPIFSIYGDLIISEPPGETEDKLRLLYVEVLMMAELNFVEDCFKVQAALAPTSFVYVPMAHLHGGFALYTFFGSNPHAGDWVFSIGGYHRSFDVPAHYPRPDRIGLDFSVGIVSIRGDFYFAVTPKAIMLGALLHCELSLGIIFAWLDISFDAIIQFHPVHYWISADVQVGIECDIPLLIVTWHIRIRLGAHLAIEGPDFGGTAYVDFWFCGFSFPFGVTPKTPDPLDLPGFYKICQEAGPPDTANTRTTATEGLTVQLKFSLENGAFPMPSDDTIKSGENSQTKTPDDAGPGAKWFVKGGSFKFRVSSVFALTSAFLETPKSGRDATVLLHNQDQTLMEPVQQIPPKPKLSSIPMNVFSNITAEFYVGIRDKDDPSVVIEGFKPSWVVKAMPQVVWNDTPPDRLSNQKGTIDLPMAVTLEHPDPKLAVSKVLPVEVTNMQKSSAGINKLPEHQPVQDKFLAADDTNSPQTWPTMQSTWESSSKASADLAQAIVSKCMSTLGWDKPPPDILAKADQDIFDPWVLDSKLPNRLVTGTGGRDPDVVDGLAAYYLELPRVMAS